MDTLAFYTVDEAKSNIDWALAELPKRREQERASIAAELYELTTLNHEELGDEMTLTYYELCNKPNVSGERLKKILEEVKERLKHQFV